MNFDTYDRLVRRAYAGVSAQDEWVTLLRELCQVLNVEQASLLLSSRTESPTHVVHNFNLDPQFIADYEEYYCAIDPGKQFVSQLSVSEWYVDEDWISKEQKAKNEFYQDFMRPYGFAANLCASLANDPNLLAGLSLQCTPNQYDLHAKIQDDGLKLFLPHFCKAVELRFRFNNVLTKLSVGQALADMIASPVMVVNDMGEVAYANSRGEEFFGLMRAPCSGKLVASSHGEAIKLAVDTLFIKNRTVTMRLAHHKNANGRGVFLVGLPVAVDHPLAIGASEKYGVLIVHDPSQAQAAGARLLGEIYGLSVAEERLVERWAETKSLSNAALCLNVSIDTVRTQIKSVFAKTGCKGQADLADLLRQLSHLESDERVHE